MAYPISVNGVTIKTPTSFKISHYNLTKSGRVASGKMKMELVAKKRKLFLTYATLTSAQLKHILDLIDTNTLIFTVSFYDESEVLRTMNAYVGEIPMALHRRPEVGDNSIWKDVDFNFIEE